MHIDRSNYEIWIIDWLDGNLNSLQIDRLKLFLDQNPDLREEVNELMREELIPPGISFPDKDKLIKTPEEISPSQFEYLCAAYLEKDLTDSQQAELKEIINTHTDKKKTFDLIQRTILHPGRTAYKHKKSLLKRTTFQKVIRLSVIGLSAAAVISAFIIIYSVIPSITKSKPDISAINLASDSTLQRSYPVIPAVRITDTMPLPAEKARVKKASSLSNNHALSPNQSGRITLPDDSLMRITDNQQMTVRKVPVYTRVDLGKGIVSNTLVASAARVGLPDSEDERTAIGRFVSKTFREKLLKRETPSDSPLKGFEIAEAGVSGLNKLLGWQMALDVKNDETGQPRSVSFNSQILKFSAPVKKRESEP